MGWDGIDELKAAVKGWRTKSFRHLAVRHHRPLGAREDRLGKWLGSGRHGPLHGISAFVCALSRALPGFAGPSLSMVWGYARAAILRRPRLADPQVRALLRREQGFRKLRLRVREALGHDERASAP